MGHKSYTAIALALAFMVWPSFSRAADTAVTGTVVYSFSDDFYIIQSGTDVWQLRANDLSKADRRKLSRLGSEVTVQVPDRAFATYWNVRDVNLVEKLPGEYEKLRSIASVDEKGTPGMKVEGKVVYSFSDSNALIQSDDRVLMVKKNKLTVEQLKLLSQVGKSVSLSLPPDSFELLWTFRTGEAPQQTEASPDLIRKLADGVHQVKGTVMHSFEQGVNFVLANGFVFKLKQPAGSTAQLVNGTKFNRVIRDEDVIFAWAIPRAVDFEIRSPASR